MEFQPQVIAKSLRAVTLHFRLSRDVIGYEVNRAIHRRRVIRWRFNLHQAPDPVNDLGNLLGCVTQ
jgi:hypothetical protein